MPKKYTPDNIQRLNTGEVFVFGSNLNGFHSGGAARTAFEKFGAVFGQPSGIQGKSYAIPTLDEHGNKLDLGTIRIVVEAFLAYAERQPRLTFLVTKIGCGIAGFTEDEIKPLFGGGVPKNVVLPKGWGNV